MNASAMEMTPTRHHGQRDASVDAACGSTVSASGRITRMGASLRWARLHAMATKITARVDV